jgi:hypothetical protein
MYHNSILCSVQTIRNIIKIITKLMKWEATFPHARNFKEKIVRIAIVLTTLD